MATTELRMHGKRNGHGLAAEGRDTSRRGENVFAEKSMATTRPGGGFKIKLAKKSRVETCANMSKQIQGADASKGLGQTKGNLQQDPKEHHSDGKGGLDD